MPLEGACAVGVAADWRGVRVVFRRLRGAVLVEIPSAGLRKRLAQKMQRVCAEEVFWELLVYFLNVWLRIAWRYPQQNLSPHCQLDK